MPDDCTAPLAAFPKTHTHTLLLLFIAQAEAKVREELAATGQTEVPLVRSSSLEGLLRCSTTEDADTTADSSKPSLVRQNTRTKGFDGTRTHFRVRSAMKASGERDC